MISFKANMRTRQLGGLTLFTATLILILMTLMVVYATRVSIFETRVSGNDLRQKEAFHVAEAAVDQGTMYLLANAGRLLSSQLDAFPDGNDPEGFTGDGWFAVGNVRWKECPPLADRDAPGDTYYEHPCGGEFPAIEGSWIYDTDDNFATLETIGVNTTDFADGTTVRMTALLCFIELGTITLCDGLSPPDEDEETESSLVMTLMAYGYSDCDTSAMLTPTLLHTATNLDDICTGKATVAQPVSNYKNLAGSPSVPFVTKSTFPPTGTAEIVGNPNGGGVGVPLTTWINENPACSPGSSILDSGSWQTCELQEWYHVEEYPDGVTCTDNNCYCGPAGNDTDFFLSWRKAADTNIGIDIVIDPLFPCDLFEFYFGVPRSLYQVVKNSAQIMSDCSGLGPHSSGLIWISGAECKINANTSVGSPGNPVILISAATSTDIRGGANIYGVLYVFDGEDINATMETNGSATIYGAVIVDATISKLQGTFQVVHADGVLAKASGISGIGSVNGGWRDFGLPDVAW